MLITFSGIFQINFLFCTEILMCMHIGFVQSLSLFNESTLANRNTLTLYRMHSNSLLFVAEKYKFAHFAPRRNRRVICYDVVWHEFAATKLVLPNGHRMADWSPSRTATTSTTSGILSVCDHMFPRSPKSPGHQTSAHV